MNSIKCHVCAKFKGYCSRLATMRRPFRILQCVIDYIMMKDHGDVILQTVNNIQCDPKLNMTKSRHTVTACITADDFKIVNIIIATITQTNYHNCCVQFRSGHISEI